MARFRFRTRPPGSSRTARLRKKRAKYTAAIRLLAEALAAPLRRGVMMQSVLNAIFDVQPLSFMKEI